MPSTYIITGASRGIGLEFVKQISAKGDIIFALARDPETASKLQPYIDNKKVFTIKGDVNDYESLEAAAKEIEKIAPEGVDVLINNAGLGSFITPDKVDKKELVRIFETNVVGVSDSIRAFLPLLRKRGEDKIKKIVTISSILGSIGLISSIDPHGRTYAYNISKAGVNMLTKIWSNILAKENFIVYSSHPGWVKTDMGGENAPLEAVDSISGQLEKIESAVLTDNGGFFDYSGSIHPW